MSGFALWWRCGICSKQSLRNSEVYELTRRRSVSPGTGVHAVGGTAFAVQNPRIDDIEKQVEQEVQLVSRLVEMRGFEPRFVLLHPTPSTCLFGD